MSRKIQEKLDQSLDDTIKVENRVKKERARQDELKRKLPDNPQKGDWLCNKCKLQNGKKVRNCERFKTSWQEGNGGKATGSAIVASTTTSLDG